MVGGGPIWGVFVAMFFTHDFANRAIPVLDQYTSKKYGKSWEKYKEQVPWKLWPGIY